MASFFSSVRQGFGRQNNKGNNQPNKGNGQQSTSPTSYQNSSSSLAPSMPQMPHSPALSPAITDSANSENQQPVSRKPPFFFREEYSGLIVKGNLTTLAVKPMHVEEGEWLAHQVVEQNRLLDSMIQIIRAVDDRTGLPICNPESCPSMSASGHIYTWLDHNKRPIKIPACHYMQLVQKWIWGKINDSRLFPTDPSFSAPPTFASGGLNTPHANTPIAAGPTTLNAPLSSLAGKEWLGKASGFPENFESDIKSIYRQMARCYAHIYYGHWLEPFYHISAFRELNTCYIHFVNVGKMFGLLTDKDLEPMQPLIDLWIAKGLLPSIQQATAKGETSDQSSNGGIAPAS